MAFLPVVFLLGHLVESISGEHSRSRLWLMKVFARYIEVPLLHLSWLACVGKWKFLSRFFLTRWLIIYPFAFPFGHYGDTGRPVPTDELLAMIDTLPGRMAVGPCRCRIGHKACSHPLETDIVIRTGTDVWLQAFPHEYRVISKEETKKIIKRCADMGLFHMVFFHCLVGGAMNEYVICNCCTDGCVPFILNRCLGQDIFPLAKGEWRASVDSSVCVGCGNCVMSCPFGARGFEDGRPSVSGCFGCGICGARCATGATSIEKPV